MNNRSKIPSLILFYIKDYLTYELVPSNFDLNDLLVHHVLLINESNLHDLFAEKKIIRIKIIRIQ